jgi:hypothetical protein
MVVFRRAVVVVRRKVASEAEKCDQMQEELVEFVSVFFFFFHQMKRSWYGI